MSDFICDCSVCRSSGGEHRIVELETDNQQLRKLNSDYKHQIHTLRQRCESLVMEMEGLRAARSATPVVRHFDGINQEPQQED